MARPLRIDVDDGWCHVMSRGIERRVIFLDDSFQELSQLCEQAGGMGYKTVFSKN